MRTAQANPGHFVPIPSDETQRGIELFVSGHEMLKTCQAFFIRFLHESKMVSEDLLVCTEDDLEICLRIVGADCDSFRPNRFRRQHFQVNQHAV